MLPNFPRRSTTSSSHYLVDAQIKIYKFPAAMRNQKIFKRKMKQQQQ